MRRIILPGIPIAKVRARHRVVGNHAMTYDPQHKEKLAIKEILKSYEPLHHYDSYKASFLFALPYPASFSTGDLNLIKWQILDHPSNKDIDNLVKFYLDCANGILFRDDREIIHLTAQKSYSLNPQTIIEIIPMNDTSLPQAASDILAQISPEETKEFISDIHSALSLPSLRLDDFEKIPNSTLVRIAYMLSLFADKHSEKLKKIAKKCPEKWKECLSHVPTNARPKC